MVLQKIMRKVGNAVNVHEKKVLDSIRNKALDLVEREKLKVEEFQLFLKVLRMVKE